MKAFLYRSYCIFYSAGRWRRMRFTGAGIMVLITIPVAPGLGLDTYRSLIYQIFSLFWPLLLLAVLWSPFFRIRLRASRKLPEVVTVGEPFEYRIVFHNRTASRQTGLICFENVENPCPDFSTFVNSREPGEDSRNLWDRRVLFHRWLWLLSRSRKVAGIEQSLPGLQPDEKNHVTIQATPLQRGYLRFTGITVARPDPLGLFHALHAIPLPDRVLVLPRRYRLPRVSLSGRRHYHSGGVSMAASVGNSDEFISLRAYRPGDPMKQIHWKSWAKTNELIIREYQDEFFVRHALILDTFDPRRYSDEFEEAVSIAASLVGRIDTPESLLDLLFVGSEAYCFSSGRGTAPAEKMLEILACVQTCTDKAIDALAPLIRRSAPQLSGCICILLAWDRQRQEFIRQLTASGLPVIVIVVTSADPESIRNDPGPMQPHPDRFHVVRAGHAEEGLTRL